MFEFHPLLTRDCFTLGEFPLSRLLLMNDANYPWFILVPLREGIAEVYQLSASDQIQLTKESSYLAKKLAEEFKAEKMNVAALGNVVPQLHLHHIVRYRNDAAWPAPVWGKVPAKPYSEEALKRVADRISALLTEDFTPVAPR